jgi:hypothetical protein
VEHEEQDPQLHLPGHAQRVENPRLSSASLKVLLFVKNTGSMRTIWPVVRALAARGHQVTITAKEVKSAASKNALERLAEETGVTLLELPYVFQPGWSDLARGVRRGIDYLRYSEPRYRDATKLRARAERVTPPFLRGLANGASKLGPRGAAALSGGLRGVDRCLLPSPRVEAFLAEQRPDVVLVHPLIGFGSTQADVVRAANRLGIRCAYPVASWDNLTNKGLLRDSPDLVLVWNELQKAEAVELHRVPAERVRVTGAPPYDHWFDWRPARGRDEFCREVGLDPGRPIVLYAGSSNFVAPDEPAFVRRWLAALRSSGGPLAEANVLVRPHPVGAEQWEDFDPGDADTVVWPPLGQEPLDDAGRQNYFDSLYHAGAVVGINTSAMIEAAIVCRPVLTILAEEFRATQGGTLHFHYLIDPEFGHVRVARSFDEHARQLERSLAEGDAEGLNERFLRRFIRPYGLDVPATPLYVEAIEELAAGPKPTVRRDPAAAPLVRLALTPVARSIKRERRRRKRAGRASAAPSAGEA